MAARPQIRYRGGPLDGELATGRHGIWRDEQGQPVPTTVGDKRFLGRGAVDGYVYMPAISIYAHTSTWKQTLREERAALQAADQSA